MISNILVATDGSETAGRAVDLAAQLASGLGVPMTVGHVLQHGARVEELGRLAETEHLVRHAGAETPPHVGEIPSDMAALFSDAISGAESKRMVAVIGDEIVARAAARAREAGAADVSTRVVDGDYDEGILVMARDVGADTIVIGRRGLGRVQRVFEGSVSRKVARQADCTVISVP